MSGPFLSTANHRVITSRVPVPLQGLEGYMGIEPTLPAWKAGVIAIIRIPHKYAHLCAGRPRLVVYKLPARMGLGHCLTAHGAVGEFRNPDLTLTKGVFFPLNYDSIHICVRVYHRYLTS